MNVADIIILAKEKAKALGIENPVTQLVEILCLANSKKELKHYNEYLFVIEVGHGVSVQSDFGRFCDTDIFLPEKEIMHRGVITVENNSVEDQYAKFIKLII